jgi:Uma2 family endonuclease
MTTMIVDDFRLTIPSSVADLDSFRQWTKEPDFPERGNIWWLRGGIWADMSHEQIFSHVLIKGVIFRVLAALVEKQDLGLMLADGLLFTNEEAGISGSPDATFISFKALRAGRVHLVEGKTHGFTEVVGSPDMLLEVVSDGSEGKDLVVLPEDYFHAGIREFWRADVRQGLPVLEIFRRGAKGFTAVRKQSGWLRSAVFGKSFRLAITQDQLGNPKYQLKTR